MEQLLVIHNIPLKMDVKVEPGKYEESSNPSSSETNSANRALDTANQDTITLNSLSGDNSQSDGSDVVTSKNEASMIDATTQDVNTIQMKFVPRKVECKVQEFPHLEIEYLGKPIYAPPSSDPDRKREQMESGEKDTEDKKTDLNVLV